MVSIWANPMRWHIDQPVQAGENTFAAIVETKIDIRLKRGVVIGQGEKRPFMYLMVRCDAVTGLDIHGNVYTKDEIEHLYPTAITQLGILLSKKL